MQTVDVHPSVAARPPFVVVDDHRLARLEHASGDALARDRREAEEFAAPTRCHPDPEPGVFVVGDVEVAALDADECNRADNHCLEQRLEVEPDDEIERGVVEHGELVVLPQQILMRPHVNHIGTCGAALESPVRKGRNAGRTPP